MQSSSMKASSVLGAEYARELESEVRATRECLEKVPMDKSDWKPHEKSMNLGYLALLVADIPRWIHYTIEESEIDFATYEQFKGETAEELVAHFEKSVEAAKQALLGVTDGGLKESFYLKNQGRLLFTTPKDESISSSINHMVHHRGQLTVYLRLNDIAVPSIYGPSADSGGF
jgi:uncharacterized damage-inducible protein DinB